MKCLNGLSLTVTLWSVATVVQGFTPSSVRHRVAPTSSRRSTSSSKLFMTMRSNPNSENPLEALTKQFGNLLESTTQQTETKPPSLPDRVVDPDYRLGGIFLVAGLLLDAIPYIQILLGVPVTLLAILFLVQTYRLRFVFDETSFSLKQGNELEETGENIVVGGENSWTYDSFVNYDFFPKDWIDQPQGPILVYFKETQTPSDKWDEGPGAKANSEEALAAGAKPGQVHFFPAVCNSQQLREEFAKRGCAKI